MNIKSLLKKISGIKRIIQMFSKYSGSRSISKPHGKLQKPKDDDFDLNKLSNDELLSLMRHESHRIEKAVYNDILHSKKDIYHRKWRRIGRIHHILKERNFPLNEPTLIWSRHIYDSFDNLEINFIKKNSLPPPRFELEQADQFIFFLRSRRSVRVWAEEQPDVFTLKKIIDYLIDAARWAPTSGNRQPWRFLVLTKQEEKNLLRKIKEDHCISAPLLVFVGMDTRLYGALGNPECAIYIDAGAAIMQMVLAAHKCGVGVAWNHLADDLINSRKTNRKIYDNFTSTFNIPKYIAPVAVLSIGLPEFIPPEPARMNIENLILNFKDL